MNLTASGRVHYINIYKFNVFSAGVMFLSYHHGISGSVTPEHRAFTFCPGEDKAILAADRGSRFLTGRSKDVGAAEPSTCSTADKELEYAHAKPQAHLHNCRPVP